MRGCLPPSRNKQGLSKGRISYKKQQKIQDAKEVREFDTTENPEILEKEKKVQATKDEREKKLQERKDAAAAKKKEADDKRAELLKTRAEARQKLLDEQKAKRDALLNKKNENKTDANADSTQTETE